MDRQGRFGPDVYYGRSDYQGRKGMYMSAALAADAMREDGGSGEKSRGQRKEKHYLALERSWPGP